MFLNYWQLKVTALVLLLSSSLGQKLLQACDRDYCYERSIENRNIKADYSKNWNRDESRVIDTERRNTFREKFLDNHVKQLDSDFIRHVSRKILNGEEAIRLEYYRLRKEYRIVPSVRNTITDDYRNSERSRVNLLTVNKQDDYQDVDRRSDGTGTTELLRERYIERRQIPVISEDKDRSVTSTELLNPNTLQRLPARKLATLDKYERRLIENERSTRNRQLIETISKARNQQLCDNRLVTDQFFETERLPEERENLSRFSERSGERLSYKELEKAENQDDTIKHIRFSLKRLSESAKRFERTERDEFRRLSLRQPTTFNNFERRLNERDQLTTRINRRLIETISKERKEQDCGNKFERKHDLGQYNDRYSETERLPEESESFRQLSDRKNQRSSEHHSQEIFDKESTLDSSRLNLDRKSLILNERIDKHFQGIRERYDRIETLNTRDNRYDISRRLNEREQVSAQRRSGNTPEYPHNRDRFVDSGSETNQRELKDRQHDMRSVSNDRSERRNQNLKERVDVLIRNAETRRLNSRQIMSEREILYNRDDIQRNIREHDEEESKRIRETQDFLIDENISPRRSLLVRESVERRYENVKELDERRESKHDNNKENRGSRRLGERKFEDNEIMQRRIETHDTRRHNKRQNKNKSRRTMESIVNQVIEVEQRSVKSKRESNFIRQDENPDHKDSRYMIDKYIEKPTISLNRGYMTLGQGALLAYIVMRTVNGKTDIKCNIYQKLQEAIALMGF